MGRKTQDLVFGPDGGTEWNYKPAQWEAELLKNKAAYENLYVANFTRVKNLGSDYMHEYVQFILEDRKTKERARVYAERLNEHEIDNLVVGRDESIGRQWKEIPLPLFTVIYDEPAKQPSVFDVAHILAITSTVGGAYNFLGNNCFWFSYTSFESLRLKFPGKLKNWNNRDDLGGKGGGGIEDLKGLFYVSYLKDKYIPTANEFDINRKKGMDYQEPNELRTLVSPVAYITSTANDLLSSNGLAAYGSWAELSGDKVDKKDLEKKSGQVVQTVKEQAEKGNIQWTQDFDIAREDIIDKVLDDPSADKYIAKVATEPGVLYLPPSFQGEAKSDTLVDEDNILKELGAQTEDFKLLAKALTILTGRVLVESE